MTKSTLQGLPHSENRNSGLESRPLTPEDLERQLRQVCAQVMREVLLGGPIKRAKRRLGYSKKSAFLYDQLHGEERTALETLCIEIDAALSEPTKPRGEALAAVHFLMSRYLSDEEALCEVSRRSIDSVAIEAAAAGAKAAQIAHRAIADERVGDREMAQYRIAAERRDRLDSREDALMTAAWEATRGTKQ